MTRLPSTSAFALLAALLLLTGPGPSLRSDPLLGRAASSLELRADAAVQNFSEAMQRLVDLVATAGGALLALVWARVAISWFSNDVTKKIQAKDRARDALVGTLIFGAALSGLIWGLAQWVLTGR